MVETSGPGMRARARAGSAYANKRAESLRTIAALGSPSMRELAAAWGVRSTNAVACRLRKLVRDGLVITAASSGASLGRTRAIALTPLGWAEIGIEPCVTCGHHQLPPVPEAPPTEPCYTAPDEAEDGGPPSSDRP